MIDETDISQEKKWSYEVRAGRVVKNLQKRNMNGQYVSSRQEALSVSVVCYYKKAEVLENIEQNLESIVD